MTKHLNSMAVLAFAGVAALGIASVSAHHSATMFDHSTTMTINGEVVELRWVNPHVSLSINGIVKERAEDGRAVWVMEMTSPGNLVRAGGWRRDAVKPGDKVEVEFSPLRDSERKGRRAEESHRGRDRRGLHRQPSRAGAAGARMSRASGFLQFAAVGCRRARRVRRLPSRQDAERPAAEGHDLRPQDLDGRDRHEHGCDRDHAGAERQARRRRGAGARRHHLDHADVVSAPVSGGTNQWKPGADRDPATDTFASPDVWANFADFYQRASGCLEAGAAG